MTWVFLAVFGTTLFWITFTKRDYFSPGVLYVLAYSFCLAINSLALSHLQSPWAWTTRYLFWGATALFLAATGIVNLAEKVLRPDFRFDLERMQDELTRDAKEMDWKWFAAVFTA